jgi:NAD(P)-dependent dehydrogenase (short-subunit alcohol dehydrogenase family)
VCANDAGPERPDELSGKVAIVTGGTSGIGRAVAIALGRTGAHVVLGGRDSERGAQAVAEVEAVGGKAVFVQHDVRTQAGVAKPFDVAESSFGAVDIVLNGAAVLHCPPPESVSEKAVDDSLATNLKGVFLGTLRAIDAMRGRGGVIVNPASVVGTVLFSPERAINGMTKAGVVSLTRSLTPAAQAEKIRLYATCFWATNTPLLNAITGVYDGDAERARERYAAAVNPSKTLVDPADMATSILNLFRSTCQYANGSVVEMEGATTNILDTSELRILG